MTELDVHSSHDNQPIYFFSFAQVRIAASSSLNSLALVGRWPKYLPGEVYSAKTTVSNTKAANLDITLGMNPTIKPGISAGQTTALEKVTTGWNLTSHRGNDVDEAAPPLGTRFAVWKYVHNDEIYDRLEGWCFEPDDCPSALFGFEQIQTEVQVQITVFWSLNQVPSKRRDFPIMWRRAKEHKSIYENFLHQAVASVGLEKVPQSRSWVMPDQKAHTLAMEDLGPSKGSVHFRETIATAKQFSECGELDSIVSTECTVMMKTAVEGKVTLTATERTSDYLP